VKKGMGIFMNNGSIQMCKSLSSQALDMQIAQQCAPLLTGIKMSNILITHSSNTEKVYEIFRHTSVEVKCIYWEAERITFLLYQPEELIEYLNKSEIQLVMVNLGYGSMDIDYIMEGCAFRFSAHKKERSQFPHELGLLLGYPVADVVGFMENYGRNFLYSGYWKVYSNLQGALDTFHQYKKAKEEVTRLVTNGLSINRILMHYQLGNERLQKNQLIAV
jgi:hypothetical protein